MKKKIALSAMLLAVYTIFYATVGRLFVLSRTPLVGQLSTTQLSDSDAEYVKSTWEIEVIKGLDPTFPVFLLLLIAIWFVWRSDIKKMITSAALLTVIGATVSSPAHAYYAKMDYAEVVEILPNQTAFLIPETGANKAGQAAFMSADYLNGNKVAMKRVTIPHVKLENSSLMSDYYVPASRLLIVDRTPATREWVTDANRGTTAKDQGFRFESRESINISTGVVISAFVKEEDAAKFVYWFGSKSVGEVAAGDNETRFASIIYARSLADVIDDNVHRKVQAVLAREFGKRSMTEAAAQKAEIIEIADKEVKETFAPMGITISFVGYAEGLSYDKPVQDAINNVFLATKRAEVTTQLMASVPYEQAMVNINFINAQSEAMKAAAAKWDGKLDLPSWVVIPQGLTDGLTSWIGKGKQPEAKSLDAKPASVTQH